jgi:hypothetical protein
MQTGDVMRAEQIYEGFIRFEERAAALYLELSVRFFDNPDLSWFWVEMAMEEKQHAGMLQFCREAGVFAASMPDNDQVSRLNTLFNHLEARLRAAALTLDDAFELAIELEASEINEVYGRLTAPIEGPAHILRKKMELLSDRHFDRLRDAADRFGASPGLRTKLGELLSRPQDSGGVR